MNPQVKAIIELERRQRALITAVDHAARAFRSIQAAQKALPKGVTIDSIAPAELAAAQLLESLNDVLKIVSIELATAVTKAAA